MEGEKDLQILVCTANIGNAEPTMASLSCWVPEKGECSGVAPLPDCTRAESGQFDLICVGMQEATWKKGAKPSDHDDADYEPEDKTESSYSEKPSGGSPTLKQLSPSNLSERASEAIQTQDTIQIRGMLADLLGPDYKVLVQQQRGQMRLFLFAKRNLQFSNIEVKCENTGIGHVLANKGGIVANITYMDTRLTFFTAHLAAHEGKKYYQTRCDNVREILRGTKNITVEPYYDAAVTSHYMFVCGDLNFRTKFPVETDASTEKPTPEEKEKRHEESVKRALGYVSESDWSGLYAFDELEEGLKNGDLLQGFRTLPCQFSPTFKVLREEGFNYKEQRTPSYTDRVLYKSSSENVDAKPWAYEACPGFITSDHKPVRAAFSVTPNAILTSQKSVKVPPTHLIFSNLKCKDLPVMDVDGSSDPYLMFVLEPDIRVEKKLSRRNLLPGAKRQPVWDQTKFLAKNLSPEWQEEIDLLLKGHGDGDELSADCMLYITCMDFDATSKDDLMGTLALNVRDILAMVDSSSGDEGANFDRPLIKYGEECGRIQFTLKAEGSDGSRRQKKNKDGVFRKAKTMLGIKDQQK